MTATKTPGRGGPLGDVNPAGGSQQPRPGTTLDSDAIWRLVQSVQAGDTAAFGPIYHRYAGYLSSYVQQRVANRQTAEDITSETFTKALRGINGFTWQGRDFGAWLTTIARNLIVDHYKCNQRRYEVLHYAPGVDEHATGLDNDPEMATITALRNRALLKAMLRLNQRHRTVLVLRFFEGCNLRETAELLGITVKATKALQYRATLNLTQVMES
jgi:RNA polymerase sigma-70 factor, ECF subfamily